MDQALKINPETEVQATNRKKAIESASASSDSDALIVPIERDIAIVVAPGTGPEAPDCLRRQIEAISRRDTARKINCNLRSSFSLAERYTSVDHEYRRLLGARRKRNDYFESLDLRRACGSCEDHPDELNVECHARTTHHNPG